MRRYYFEDSTCQESRVDENSGQYKGSGLVGKRECSCFQQLPGCGTRQSSWTLDLWENENILENCIWSRGENLSLNRFAAKTRAKLSPSILCGFAHSDSLVTSMGPDINAIHHAVSLSFWEHSDKGRHNTDSHVTSIFCSILALMLEMSIRATNK